MTNKKNFHRFPAFLLLSIIACFSSLPVPTRVLGQTALSSLTIRTIQANSKNPIDNVTVTITDGETGRSQVKTTGANGEVVFGNLEPGKYEVRATHSQFRQMPSAADHDVVPVLVNQRVTFELKLVAITPRPGPERAPAASTASTAAAITTTGSAQEVTTANRKELLEIPNINNDLTPLLQLVPGAIAIGSTALGRIVIDGKGKDQQIFKLDGIDSTPMVDMPAGDSAIGVLDSFQKQSVTALNVNLSAVKSGAFESQYGPGTGTVANSVTQQGRKDFAYETSFLPRNDALNARNYFDYDGKNALRRSQFGGKIGGPIIPKNPSKSLFFLGYEGIRGRTERNLYEAIPSDVLCGCGTGPIAPLLEGFLPRGTAVLPGASLDSDFVIARRRVRTTSESNAWDLRLDFYPFLANSTPVGGAATSVEKSQSTHSADTFAFRFTRQAAEAILPDGVTGRLQRQRILLVNALAKAEILTANYTHTIRLGLNETRAHVDTEVVPLPGADMSQSLISIDKMVKTTGLPDGLPMVPVASVGGLIKGAGRGFDLTPISFIIGYDAWRAFNTGSQELRFGVESQLIRLRYDRLGGLTYSFRDTAALRADTPSNVTLLSDLSGPSPFGRAAGPRRVNQEYLMGYVQMLSRFWAPGVQPGGDSKLSITYGLRYDYFGSARERDDRAVVVNPQTGEFLPPGTPYYRARRLNFQPRIGIEYQLPIESGPLGKTTLRGNIGVYSGVPRIGDLLLSIDSDRFSTGREGGAFPASPGDLRKDFQENPLTRQYQPLAFARDFATPERAYKWEAILTRILPAAFELKYGYIGNLGRNLPLATIANPIVRVETNPDPAKSAIVIRQFDILHEGSVLKPFGEFFYRASKGRSNYNAMTISLQGNSSGNQGLPRLLRLRLKTQYALSRNVGNASGTLASDPSSFDSDYGYNAADARHSFVLQTQYSLDDLFGSPTFKLLGGWLASTTVSARSGLPLIIRLTRPDVAYVDASGNVFSQAAIDRQAIINTPGGGSTGGARVPDILAGVNPYLRKDLELLNPAAFATPKPGTFGNLTRGKLRGPASLQVDFALQKRLFDNEKAGLMADLKIEVSNLLNHANFNNPTAALPNALPTTSLDNQLQPGVPFTRATSGTFGIINAADPGRQIQVSVVLRFRNGFN